MPTVSRSAGQEGNSGISVLVMGGSVGVTEGVMLGLGVTVGDSEGSGVGVLVAVWVGVAVGSMGPQSE